MSTPIRVGPNPVLVPAASAGASGPAGAFAARLGGLGGAVAAGVQTLGAGLGRQVVAAALGGIGMPPVLSNLAQNAVAQLTGQAVPSQDQASLDLVDKTRFLLMMNAIFDAANAPLVERL